MKFNKILLDILKEQGKTIKDLEKAGILSERSFYHYKTYSPLLPQAIKIANYLNVSLDYLAGRTIDNNFHKYNLKQSNFYSKLMELLKTANISQSQIARELKFGRPNFTYWKNGSLPRFSLIIDIADFLKCSIDDIIE